MSLDHGHTLGVLPELARILGLSDEFDLALREEQLVGELDVDEEQVCSPHFRTDPLVL